MKNGKGFILLLSVTLALGACTGNDKPKENATPAQASVTKGKIIEPEMHFPLLLPDLQVSRIGSQSPCRF